MPTLRDYQNDALIATISELNKPNVQPFIVQAATGAGKSLMIAAVARVMKKKTLILQPSKELMIQNYDKMIAFGIEDVQKYSASVGEKNIGQMTMATIGSIYKKPELFSDVELIIIDEAHLINSKDTKSRLMMFLSTLGVKRVVGLTATPYRQDTVWLRLPNGMLESSASLKMINRMTRTPFFKKIVYKIETQELIERGYLSPIKYFTENVSWADLKVNSTGADFTEESLEKFASTKIQRIVDAVRFSEKGKRFSLTFCSTISQAEEVSSVLEEEYHIYAPVVTGKTPPIMRTKIVAGFKDGTIKHVINVGVFTTGFDAPKLDTVIMAKPTISLALWYQIVGRGVRLDPDKPDKVLHVYDLAGVTKRLGRVETICIRTETGGFRDEVWSERGRMDGYPLYSFVIEPKPKEKK